jgi:hypothetical protein
MPPGLWAINLLRQETNTHKASSAYSGQITTAAIKFLHVACFSPTTATWTQAINKGFFRSIPALTAKTVYKQLPKSMATAMGHMDQIRKNVRSTRHRKQPSNKEVKEFNQDSNPSCDNSTTNQIFAGMVDLYAPEPEGKLYLDLTGRFPAKSQDGSLYVLILYTYDNNAILVKPLKNRTDGEQLPA